MDDLTPEQANKILDGVYPNRVYKRYSYAMERLERRKRILQELLDLHAPDVLIKNQRRLVRDASEQAEKLHRWLIHCINPE